VWDDLIRTHGNPQADRMGEAIAATPDGQQLAKELRTKADRQLLEQAGGAAANPLYAGISSAANTALLNIPRNVAAAARSVKTGKPFEEEYQYLRDIDEAAGRQSPWSAGLGTLAGALGGAAVIPVGGATSALGRAAIGAGTGAATSGIAEFADTKDVEKARNAALLGGAIGGIAAPVVSGIVSAPVNAVAAAVSKKPVVPTTDELRAASQAAYKAADDAGVVVNRSGIRGVADEIKNALVQEAYHPKNQPKLSNFVSELDKLSIGNAVPGQPPNIGATLSGLETVRKMLRSARSSGDAEEARLAKIAADKFDDYLANLKPSQIAAGDMKAGAEALKEARSLWSSYRKADLVDEALQKAQTRAASTGSGGNIDNAIRQEFRRILQNPKTSAGFSDSEKAALARVVTGTKGQNTLRLLGKLSPQGDGLRLMLSLGAAGASGGASLPISALGAGAKALADRATPANVERLSQMIRARGANIDPAELVNAARADRLRNFFTSIGVNFDKVIRNEMLDAQ
jgi:hypothetical protein